MPNADALRKKMKECGITQGDLAKYLGIATPTMSQKINNIRPFTLDEAEKVASALHIADSDFGSYFFGR